MCEKFRLVISAQTFSVSAVNNLIYVLRLIFCSFAPQARSLQIVMAKIVKD